MKRQTRLYFTRERMRQVRNSTFAQAAEPSTKGPVQAERTAGTADSDGISMDTKDKSSHKSGIRITEKESPSLKSKLREEKFSSANEAAKLRFKKAETSAVKTETPPARRRVAGKMAEQAVSSALHEKVSEYEEDNVGVEAANRSGQAVEAASETVENVRYGRKLRAYRSAEKLEKQAAGQELHAMYEKKMAMNPEAASNPISRWRQRRGRHVGAVPHAHPESRRKIPAHHHRHMCSSFHARVRNDVFLFPTCPGRFGSPAQCDIYRRR